MSKETPYILKKGDEVVIEIECGGECGFDVYVTKNGEPIARLDTRDLSTLTSSPHGSREVPHKGTSVGVIGLGQSNPQDQYAKQIYKSFAYGVI